MPDEVIVADDGSGEVTRTVIKHLESRATYPVHHVRQEHKGFRASRLRNLAIARATGDYIVFVDGDMLLHPEFVADHRHFARRGAFTQGVRIPLDAKETAEQLRTVSIPSARIISGPEDEERPAQSAPTPSEQQSPADAMSMGPLRHGAYARGSRIPHDPTDRSRARPEPRSVAVETREPRVDNRRGLYAYHSLTLADVTRQLANFFIAIKSCNQGFWREDLVAVNGFDEDFVGWGSEDKELCARLRNSGIDRQTLLFGGIAFHLHHPPASRDRHAANERLLQLTLSEHRTRCEHGLDTHLSKEADPDKSADTGKSTDAGKGADPGKSTDIGKGADTDRNASSGKSTDSGKIADIGKGGAGPGRGPG
jgi:glycosyltransferase involved in cell wall biosynthesis